MIGADYGLQLGGPREVGQLHLAARAYTTLSESVFSIHYYIA